MNTATQYYIGIMSGTSMDGVDAVLIQMQGSRWLSADAHAFLPYPDDLKQDLLDLQNIGDNELHRSQLLAQKLSTLYAQTCHKLLQQTQLNAQDIRAIGCHGQTIRHAPEQAYSIQLVNLPLLAEQTGIFTVGDFRSRDLAAGGQGAPLVPAFHQALFSHAEKTRVVLNIGGIANISVLPPQQATFGFDTGPGNMLADAWMQHIWQLPYDKNGEKAAQGVVLPNLLSQLIQHDYFQQAHPKSTGRELFALPYLQQFLQVDENPNDVLRTLIEFTSQTIANEIHKVAPNADEIYVCGGGIRNQTLMNSLATLLPKQRLASTSELNLDPQWVEAAAFAWLAACWCEGVPSNPHQATGAHKPCILGCGYYA
ncbi:MAG: anhydro-N-acetylmuramic acid kinase [Neisseria sp.]|nr:anhydro-N-acetylmuramic acid kinase [Neisseria sp.]